MKAWWFEWWHLKLWLAPVAMLTLGPFFGGLVAYCLLTQKGCVR